MCLLLFVDMCVFAVICGHVCIFYACVSVCVCLCVCVCTFLQVVVSVGRFLSYTPGSITFVQNILASFPILSVVGGVAGGGVGPIFLLVLVVVIIVVVSRRDSVRKRQQVKALMIHMETLKSNMADEGKKGNKYLGVFMYIIHPSGVQYAAMRM